MASMREFRYQKYQESHGEVREDSKNSSPIASEHSLENVKKHPYIPLPEKFFRSALFPQGSGVSIDGVRHLAKSHYRVLSLKTF
jgi:hypothetical protein